MWASILTDKLLNNMKREQFFYISTKKELASMVFTDQQRALDDIVKDKIEFLWSLMSD